MKKFILAAALYSCLSSSVLADGALAVAIPAGGLRESFAFGRAIGGTDASERAMAICVREAEQRGMNGALCKVVEKFRGACISLALDPVSRWAGWSVAESAEKAASEALRKCGEGAPACKTHSTECDRNS